MSSERPGRRLPTTVEQIHSAALGDDAKHLIVRLVALMKPRFVTATAMIKHAMADDSARVPSWAAGKDAADPKQVSAAASAVAKFLGAGASRMPDWPSTEWIVRGCVPPEETEPEVATMAGMWVVAAGVSRPPGYTGAIPWVKWWFRRSWTFTFATSLSVKVDEVVLRAGDGQQIRFARTASGALLGPAGTRATLTTNPDGTFTLKTRDQQRFEFSSTGKLTRIADRNDQGLDLSYTGGLLHE